MTAGAAKVVDVQLRPSRPETPTANAATTADGSLSAVHPERSVSATAETRSRGTTSTASKADLSSRPGANASGARDATLALSAKPPREKRRVYTWIAAGTAVVAAAAGGYYGWSARQAESALDRGYDGAADAADATSRARRANVMYVVAGSAAAAGATLFFVEKKF